MGKYQGTKFTKAHILAVIEAAGTGPMTHSVAQRVVSSKVATGVMRVLDRMGILDRVQVNGPHSRVLKIPVAEAKRRVQALPQDEFEYVPSNSKPRNERYYVVNDPQRVYDGAWISGEYWRDMVTVYADLVNGIEVYRARDGAYLRLYQGRVYRLDAEGTMHLVKSGVTA